MVKIGMKRIWASLAGSTEKRLDLRDVIKEEAARFGPPPKGVRQEREKSCLQILNILHFLNIPPLNTVLH